MLYSYWATNRFFLLLLLLQSSSTSTGFPCGQLPGMMYLSDIELKLEPFCDDNQAMILVNDQGQMKSYQVKSIDTTNMTIRLIDPGLKPDNCSSLPRYRTTYRTFFSSEGGLRVSELSKQVVLGECPFLLPNSYVATSPCFNSSREINHNLQAVLLSIRDYHSNFLPENCSVVASTIAEIGECLNCSFADIHQRMNTGFNAHYYIYIPPLCERRPRSFLCLLKAALVVIIDALPPTVLRVAESFFIARSSVGALIMLAVIAYKLLRRHLSTDESIEEFLQQYKKSIPKTYSYLHIIKITRNFKEKLGKGGFGSVYKGKLSSGQLVAVKMLSDSKGNGQDFINEIATIGRIHHTNIVQLLGFCSAGTRRALVYQYMPNGSLDKHIFSTEAGHSLSWDKVYQIAIGIARGIQYLHQGCDMKILHFDIKPHNILLDGNLTPKISDFGLSKYCSTDQSVVSVTAMRGTIGYMAPELFYKSSAGVSSKSDVYSYGMLLMEMAGKRKNINPTAKTSQVYFPSWIYDKLHEDLDVGAMLDASEGEKEVVKKLLIVGLWCIQMKPMDRPSMAKVVEMLEGSVELLQMPPKPFLSSPGRDDDEYNIVIDTSSSWVADEPISPHSCL